MGLSVNILDNKFQQRFFSRVEIVPVVPCHFWVGQINAHGYGIYNRHRAHRLAYEIANGPIPNDMDILHSCDNPCCVNPQHLRAGTQAENMKDAQTRGRFPKRLKHHWGVHSDEILDAVCVKIIQKVPNSQIAKRFNVSATYVSAIRHGKKELARFTALGGTPASGRSDRKLSDSAAISIFESRETAKTLAARFGVSVHTVADIRTGRCYSSVTGG